MSPATLQLYAVSFKDYGAFRIVIEAVSAEMALKKARRIYYLTGIGDCSIEPLSTCPVDWEASPLVPEVQR